MYHSSRLDPAINSALLSTHIPASSDHVVDHRHDGTVLGSVGCKLLCYCVLLHASKKDVVGK